MQITCSWFLFLHPFGTLKMAERGTRLAESHPWGINTQSHLNELLTEMPWASQLINRVMGMCVCVCANQATSALVCVNGSWPTLQNGCWDVLPEVWKGQDLIITLSVWCISALAMSYFSAITLSGHFFLYLLCLLRPGVLIKVTF